MNVTIENLLHENSFIPFIIDDPIAWLREKKSNLYSDLYSSEDKRLKKQT